MSVRGWTKGVALGLSGLLIAAGCGSSSKKTSAGTTPASTAAAAPKYAPIPAGIIKLGISLPLSGATAAFGLPAQKSYQTVTLKQFNAAHPDGIDGHQIQLEILDDASDVTKAVNVANQLISDKVAAVVNLSYNPSAIAQQAAVFSKAKVPVVATLSSAEQTDTAKFPYTFAINSSVIQIGQAGAAWIAKHPEYQKIAVLTDNLAPSLELLNAILNPLKTLAPNATVVKTASISPGTTDASVAIAQLQAVKPDLLITNIGYGPGPVWQGMHAANWNPVILDAGAGFYDGYTAMGTLANTAVTLGTNCVAPDHPPLDPSVTSAMDDYATVFGTTTVNYLIYVMTDNGPLELLKKAIERYHSVDPNAIKQALETMGPVTLFNTFQYNYTPTNHFGLTGGQAANACKMADFSDGKYRLITLAP